MYMALSALLIISSLDELDDVVGDDEYMRLSKKFRGEVADLKYRMEQLAEKNDKSIDSGKRLLELDLGRRCANAKLQ